MILLVCPGMAMGYQFGPSYKNYKTGYCYKFRSRKFSSFGGGKQFEWSGGDKNILQITTGMKNDKTLGYHFPTVNMDTDKKLTVYMPKSDNWDYKVAKENM